jgi:heptosyltransferase-2
MPMHDDASVLVVAPNWLGDAVMALPAIADLRRHLTSGRLVVAARRSVADLFSMVPGVDAVIPLHWRGQLWHRAARSADEQALRGADADVAVLLPNSFASAWLLRRVGVGELCGYAADMRSRLLTTAVRRPRRSVHQVEYYQALVRTLGVSTGSAEPVLAAAAMHRGRVGAKLSGAGWESSRPLVALAPGAAYGTAKRWLPAHFAELVTTLVREQHAYCVVVGSAADRPTTQWIRSLLAEDVIVSVADWAGVTGLEDLAAVMSLARVCVTNDSGAMHVAAAVGTPVVALFGPTREHETAPTTTARRTVDVLTNPVWCRPCMLRECPIDHRCMRGLQPSTVLASALRLLPVPASLPRPLEHRP